MITRSRALALLLLCGIGVPACRKPRSDGATAQAADTTLSSGQQFANRFYGWYVAAAKQGSGQGIALRDSAAVFDPALVTALQEDARAQARNTRDVVGLDGDPFLNAQDFCNQYAVRGARYAGDTVLVDVVGDCAAHHDTLPDVTAALRRSDGRWRFVNFLYPGMHTDLRALLEQLRRDRAGRH